LALFRQTSDGKAVSTALIPGDGPAQAASVKDPAVPELLGLGKVPEKAENVCNISGQKILGVVLVFC
jgi:hypothetical protein